MSQLDSTQIRNVLQHLADEHVGDWLVVGGGAVALWLSDRRTTQDIDVVPFLPSPAARYALYGVAHDLGFPVEVVNSAADFFVHQINNWQSLTLELLRGKRGIIRRPTTTLLLLLKIDRLSEQDLDDCLAALRHAPEELDRERVLTALENLEGASEAVEDRRLALARVVEEC